MTSSYKNLITFSSKDTDKVIRITSERRIKKEYPGKEA